MSKSQDMILKKARALGKTKIKLMHVASDLINSDKDFKKIALEANLSISTVVRVSKLTEAPSGEEYRPNANTLEKLFVFFGAEITFKKIK